MGDTAELRRFRAALKARAERQPGAAALAARRQAVALGLGRAGLGGFAPGVVRGGTAVRKRVRQSAEVASAAFVSSVTRGGGAAAFHVARAASHRELGVVAPHRAILAVAKTAAVARRAAPAAGAVRVASRVAGGEIRGLAPVAVAPVAVCAPVRGAAAPGASFGRPLAAALGGGLAGSGASSVPEASEMLHPAGAWAGTGRETRGAAVPSSAAPAVGAFDFDGAMDDYFFRVSRMPLSGTPAFDPRLTPIWPGMKIGG